MTRGLQACLTIAFLAVVGKAAGTYGIYSIAQSVHQATLGDDLLRLAPGGDAARDLIRAKGIGAVYLSSVLHLQVITLAVVAMAYSAAMSGSRKAAAFVSLLALATIPVDLQLGIVHLLHGGSIAATGMPAELTWSWIPRSPVAILRRIAENKPVDAISFDAAMGPLIFVSFLLPGMLAAVVVLAGIRDARKAEREIVSTRLSVVRRDKAAVVGEPVPGAV